LSGAAASIETVVDANFVGSASLTAVIVSVPAVEGAV
jgi:hypothetical protein